LKNNPTLRVPEDPLVEPFKKEEIERLIKACDCCEAVTTERRRKFVMQRFTSKRDKAIFLTLLDTGMRPSELCAVRVEEVDMKSGKVSVRAGEAGKAKGGKGRVVFMGKSARRFLWRYLLDREDRNDPEAPLFIGKFNRPFNRDALRQLINSLGLRPA
jgi:integrase/recombinase XerD